MFKRFLSVFLAALMLVVPALAQEDFSALEPFKEGDQPPMEAVIKSQHTDVSHLTNTPDDYDVPQGAYFDGVAVKILAVVKTQGHYPDVLGDERQLWARVQIGENKDYQGIIGFMPLVNLSSKDASQKLPVFEGSLTMDAYLYLNNGLSGEVISQLASGDKVRVLGFFPSWLHVQTNGQTGFVKQEAVKMSPDTETVMAEAQILDYDNIQPGYQERYEEYMTELMKLYDKYGDSNHWPLHVSVQASETAQKYGYVFAEIVNIMPGEGDLSQEEVMLKAQEAALDLYGLKGWDSISLNYYYEPHSPDTHIWKASLWGNEGIPNIKIWMNQQGEVLEAMSDGDDYRDEESYFLEEELSPQEALAQNRASLEYYLFGSEGTRKGTEMTEEEAIAQGFAAFQKTFPDAVISDYTAEAIFMTDFTEELSWWLVTLKREFTKDITIHYHLVFIGDAREPDYTTSLEIYTDDLAWAENTRRFEQLEKERGPFYTWSLEDKADWEPDYFGLPNENDMKEEVAREKALRQVKVAFSLTDKDLEAFETASFFVLIPKRSWQINLVSKVVTPNSESPGYTVIIDAQTGKVEDTFNNEFVD